MIDELYLLRYTSSIIFYFMGIMMGPRIGGLLAGYGMHLPFYIVGGAVMISVLLLIFLFAVSEQIRYSNKNKH